MYLGIKDIDVIEEIHDQYNDWNFKNTGSYSIKNHPNKQELVIKREKELARAVLDKYKKMENL